VKTYTYKDLLVWQKAMELVKQVYCLTEDMPSQEKFGLISQMQRAAVAIPSNIAEGHLRSHKKEFAHFLSISLGSAAELETQLLVCQSIERLNSHLLDEPLSTVVEVKKMLYALIQKLDA
jgi:four helix bundle protein